MPRTRSVSRKVAPKKQGRGRTRRGGPADLERLLEHPLAKRAKLPTSQPVELATLAKEAPAGEGWLHEIKFDGYRMLCRLDRGKVRFISRNGKDWTAKFPELAETAAS